MLVTRPDGGETWPANQTFPIQWRSHNLSTTNLLANPGAELPLVGGEIPGWTETVGTSWTH